MGLTPLDPRVRTAGIRWWERLRWAASPAADIGPIPAGNPTDCVAEALSQWRRAVDPQATGTFEQRLQWAGLNPIRAGLMLLQDAAVPTDSGWTASLGILREGYLTGDSGDSGLTWLARAEDRVRRMAGTAGTEVPFSVIWGPLVEAAWQRIEPPGPQRGVTARAARDLRRALLVRLGSLGDRALFEAFCGFAPHGTPAPGEPPAREVYADFCLACNRDALGAVLATYPVLARLVATVTGQWQDSVGEMLGRLAADRPLLTAQFGIPADAVLAAVHPGLSDPHNGGRTVAILDFADEEGGSGGPGIRKLVYKPKDLRLERAYNELLEWLGTRSGIPMAWLAVADLVDPEGNHYGYVQHCPYAPAADVDELRRFQRAAGRLMALLHILGATDCHYENLIASHDRYYLIDAETLFDAEVVTAPDGLRTDDQDGSVETIRASVRRMGILPHWVWFAGRRVATDMSALGSPAAGVEPVRGRGWVDTNTDAMRWGEVTWHPVHPTSIPIPPGTGGRAELDAQLLAEGFQEMYEAMAQPDTRAGLAAAVSAMVGYDHRLVFRATRIYSALARNASSARALAAADQRAWALELLTRSYLLADQRPPSWPLLSGELMAMEECDIPFFTHPLGQTTMHIPGTDGPAAQVRDGIAAALDRLAGMSQVDLTRQLRLIIASVHTSRLVLTDRPPVPPPEPPRPPADDVSGPGESTRAARALVETIVAEALTADEPRGLTWLTPSLLPDATHFDLQFLGLGLYDGRAGLLPALYVSAADAQARDRVRIREVADGCSAPLFGLLNDGRAASRFMRRSPLGTAGTGGMLRVLQWMAGSGLCPERDWAGCADGWISHIAQDVIADDATLDVISGSAGLIPPLARAVTGPRGDRAAQLLVAAADRLLETQEETTGAWPSPMSDRPLAGLSHGASGMAWALYLAGTTLGEPKYRDGALRALQYESDVFLPGSGQWPDLRTVSTGQMGAWCHGSVGIGLVRAGLAQLAPSDPQSPQWRHELDLAMTATLAHSWGWHDHLCCGNAGRAWVLGLVGATADRADLTARSEELYREITMHVLVEGSPRLRLPAVSMPEVGFMSGFAGIAAALHYQGEPARLRDLLL